MKKVKEIKVERFAYMEAGTYEDDYGLKVKSYYFMFKLEGEKYPFIREVKVKEHSIFEGAIFGIDQDMSFDDLMKWYENDQDWEPEKLSKSQ